MSSSVIEAAMNQQAMPYALVWIPRIATGTFLCSWAAFWITKQARAGHHVAD